MDYVDSMTALLYHVTSNWLTARCICLISFLVADADEPTCLEGIFSVIYKGRRSGWRPERQSA